MQLQEWTMEEQEQLIHFLTTNTWPYHGQTNPARNLIEKTIEEGGYQSDDVKTFWVVNEQKDKVGIVKLYDLRDDIPMFDLRIADAYRGSGYGPQALKLVAHYVFHLPEQKIRLEGHTRQDNLAMRKTFERSGFVKEAHLRKAWFSPKEQAYYDAVTYGITREDFIEGTTTPVVWEDEQKEQVKKEKLVIPEQIETERLIIRAPRTTDALDVWTAIHESHHALKKWMPWAQQLPQLEDTEDNIRQAVADYITRKDLRLLLFSKETGEFIGSSGLHRINWSIPKFEIGYWLTSKMEGKGYMTEAVEAITEMAFEQLGARRVEIRCDEENVKSRLIPERLNYQLEAVLHHDQLSSDGKDLRNTCIYAKIK